MRNRIAALVRSYVDGLSSADVARLLAGRAGIAPTDPIAIKARALGYSLAALDDAARAYLDRGVMP